MTKRFEGTERYVATEDLMMAVNAAVTLTRPLLVKGEPGTGKTQLAEEVAAALGKPLYRWHIKSTTKAQHGLYEYDAVSRLRDSQLGEEKVHDIGNYIVKGRLWEAFTSDVQPVLLIDEIDKADIEFPNDLLRELRLASTGLALDQQRPLQRDGRVHRGHQVVGRDVAVGAGEARHAGYSEEDRRSLHGLGSAAEDARAGAGRYGDSVSTCCASPGRNGVGRPSTHALQALA